MASTFPVFDISKPDATSQTLTGMGQSMRDQLTFMRSCLVTGSLIGFSCQLGGGTVAQPAFEAYSRGVERINGQITWGSTGGAAGSPQSIRYTYSSDSGSTWTTIGTITYSFDASGAVTGWAWS